MRILIPGLLCLLLHSSLHAQSIEPPISDTRLSVHTLVREDIFSGWRSNNMQRLERAERNIEQLLEDRPDDRAELLVWKGGATLYRAILAHEAGDAAEFQDYYDRAMALFNEAAELDPQGIGVNSVFGGALMMFTDRLPENLREAAWNTSYERYKILWDQQGDVVAHMPVHISGELLAGLAQTTQRLGRTEESAKFVDKILEVLPDTAYGRIAREWKANPEAAATRSIGCATCHAEGRLRRKLADLDPGN